MGVFDALVEDLPDEVDPRGVQGFMSATSGDTAQALDDAQWLENYEWLGTFGDKTTYWRLAIAGALADNEQVAELLHDADTWWDYRWYDWASLELDPLRDHPDFQELMRPKG